jgi:hypothetical protein
MFYYHIFPPWLSNVHYIRESMNLYFEIALYVGISSIDPRRGSHCNVCHGYITHASSVSNVVWYNRGKVKQSIQASCKGLRDNIASQLWKEVKLHCEEKVNEIFKQIFTPLNCIE